MGGQAAQGGGQDTRGILHPGGGKLPRGAKINCYNAVNRGVKQNQYSKYHINP